MRFALLALTLLATTAPAFSQNRESPERRIERLEKELKSVQRKVFPGGAGLEPEITQQQIGTQVAGVPASDAAADLNARIDALEGQLRAMTGQAEENGYRLRQLETAFAQFRADTDSRLKALEQPTPVVAPASGGPAAADDAARPASGGTGDTASSGDPGEDAYMAGYRLWNAGQHVQAQRALDAMIKKYPKHSKTSHARNLLGRAYLDDGKPATAAKSFLANYQSDPKGERAPDSLYFLGQALVKLSKPAEACKVYDELQDVYGSTMRDWVKQRLPQARKDAKCA